MTIEWDPGWDDEYATWYCTLCDAELDHGDYDACPKCKRVTATIERTGQ